MLCLAVFLYLFADKLSPLVVSAVVTVFLVALGAVLLLRRRRRIETYARWRDVMPCYLSVQNRDLKIADANDLFRRDFGERVGEYCFNAYKGRNEPCEECPVLKTFRDGLPHTSEETVLGVDGEEVDVLVSSAPLTNDLGEVTAVVEMSTNISETKQLRLELDRSRRKHKQLFEAVPCYICVLDRNLEIQDSNTLYRTDFGEGIGLHCYEVCKKREQQCPECVVQQTFDDGKVHHSEERLTTLDGRKLDLVVYSMPIHGDDGRIQNVMEVFTDITEVKKLQYQLTMMGRAVAGMAHRTKNILMGLEGGIFVVNTGMEMDEQETIAEGWGMVERNVNLVSQMIKDLLFCSKERKPEFKGEVSLLEIVEQVRELYATRVASDKISIAVESGGCTERGVYDGDGLHNLLSNLVANAVDACRFDMDPDKKEHVITLRCRRDDAGMLVLEVEDDGAGIPDDVGDKMFQEFFSTKGTEGPGLGLLVVQKMAQEHGGNVSFTTEKGKGTVFRVTLSPHLAEAE